jgi:hypothetical protein
MKDVQRYRMNFCSSPPYTLQGVGVSRTDIPGDRRHCAHMTGENIRQWRRALPDTTSSGWNISCRTGTRPCVRLLHIPSEHFPQEIPLTTPGKTNNIVAGHKGRHAP